MDLDLRRARMEPVTDMRIGIDLGGTKIEICALAGHGDPGGAPPGQVLLRRRVATPPSDYGATVAAVRDLVDAAESELGRRGSVGVGTPGALSVATGVIKNANSTCLNGRPLDRDLAAALDRPVRLANDANCLALSEAVDGAAAGHACVFGVILGTGVGGGIVLAGRVHDGRMKIAGEWGHMPLPRPDPARGEWPGAACYCGRAGCVEAWISGPALAADHARVTGDGRTLSAEAIAAAAAAGDRAACASLDRHRDRTARALAQVVNLLDPDAIVIAGGLSHLPGLIESLPTAMAPHVFTDRFDTPVLAPRHGDSSGVRGAAWLWD